jgi:hypothetical protein
MPQEMMADNTADNTADNRADGRVIAEQMHSI